MTKTKLSSASQLPTSSSTSSAEEFLRTEYELLNQWAVHGENVSHQIFNFYVTILAAILGGLVVLIQVSFVSVQKSLLIVSGTSGFLVIMGSVFFDALVSQYIRNMHYYFSMKAIRTYFQKYHEVNSSLLKTPIRFEDKESLPRRLTLVKFGFPGGNQLTLIEIMNSILVGIAICSFIWGVAGIGYRFVPTIIVSIICWFVSEVAHRTLVNIMMKRNMEEMASSLPAQEISKNKDI
jgi:hypothetical protein